MRSPATAALWSSWRSSPATLSAQYWNVYREDVLDIVDGSLLAAYDDDTIGVQFRTAATISVAYTLLSRCSLAPEEVLHHEDFHVHLRLQHPGRPSEPWGQR